MSPTQASAVAHAKQVIKELEEVEYVNKHLKRRRDMYWFLWGTIIVPWGFWMISDRVPYYAQHNWSIWFILIQLISGFSLCIQGGAFIGRGINLFIEEHRKKE